MSTCISRAGEYSAHETTEGNYICDRCGVLDEEGLFAERDSLRAEVERERAARNNARHARDLWIEAGIALKIRAETAEAKVARVEAMADEWLTEFGPASELENVMGQQSVTIATAVRLIRAALDGDE